MKQSKIKGRMMVRKKYSEAIMQWVQGNLSAGKEFSAMELVEKLNSNGVKVTAESIKEILKSINNVYEIRQSVFYVYDKVD